MIILSILIVSLIQLPISFAFPLRADSTHLTKHHTKQPVKNNKYQSYVDTSDCQTMDKKIYAFIAGTGGGNLDQECPSNYPVLYKINQTVVYTTALPYLGATMAGGGHVQVVCCAVKHEWRT
jgi:hypothetical protein